MKLLYLCHRIPYPPHTGDKVRSFHQIRHLAKNHEISLACFAESRDDLGHVETLMEWCRSVDVVVRPRRLAKLAGLRGLATGGSLALEAFRSGALARKIRARAAETKFDAIVAFTVVMAPYAALVEAPVRVLDFVDADSEKWRLFADRSPWPLSSLYRLEADRLRKAEIAAARAWDHSIFVSEREARYVKGDAPAGAVSILGNGVDLEYFAPDPAPPGPGDAEIVFTGAMDYVPNVDAVVHFSDAIFPLIRAGEPSARFAIVGRDPAPAVRKLGDRPGVAVTGTVPDIRRYLHGARVAVAPLRIARGVQNKILEAMAMGIPVVCTPEAYEGLDAGRSEGIEVGETSEAFAAAVIRFLRDPEYRREQSARARAFVERRYRWERHGEALEALLARRRGAGP
ncbi:MAG TPA: TIGR03087 family PEP-CTERM/XrtA system glycosyltransferase [Candidatus Eisenbacteria bacterium]|nr:TIGR03087 family PEP-CTERM/XrtA system glycosyltransferase [Candidatus Eisenbacteria bacterium]